MAKACHGHSFVLKPREEIEYKFKHVVARCVDAARTQRIIELARSLETLESTKELIEAVAAPVSM